MLHKRIPFFRGNYINYILPELYMRKKEETEKICLFFFSTRSRDRTGTALLPLVFETSASTNSAIRASIVLQSCGLASRSNKELTCENRNFLELLSLSFCLLSFFHPFSLSPHQPFNFKIISLIASSIPSAS
jgi:hypothetical protein